MGTIFLHSLPETLFSIACAAMSVTECLIDTTVPDAQTSNAPAVTAPLGLSSSTNIESFNLSTSSSCSRPPSPALRSILTEKGPEGAPLPNQEEIIRADASSQGLSEPVFGASSLSVKVIETLTVSQLTSCQSSRAFHEKLMARELDTDSTTLEFFNRIQVIYIISDVRVFLLFRP